MAASPQYKIYRGKDYYEGSLKDLRLCVMVAETLGEGTEVRLGHKKTLWVSNGQPVDSYDQVVDEIFTKHGTRS